jgi:protein-S-isoprenylcysteine O-methyltransferase Ste14
MGILALVYGAIAYLIFFATFLYLIGFAGGDALTAFLQLPKTVDSGEPGSFFAPAAVTNIALLLLFGGSHSIMARQSFKRAWTKVVPTSIERSTYVLVASLALIAMFVFWRPMPEIVWQVSGAFSYVFLVLFLGGFGLVLLSTFLINHFNLFGLDQVWRAFKKTGEPAEKFQTPMLYKSVRHPLYLGFIIAFWATPTMTIGHLLFAAVWTIYIFVALGYEERDLLHRFGDDYRRYMARVPMIFPIGGRKE